MLSALEHRSTASAGEHHRPAPWRGSVVHDAAPSSSIMRRTRSGRADRRSNWRRVAPRSSVAGSVAPSRGEREPSRRRSPQPPAASRQPYSRTAVSRQLAVAVAAAAAAAVSELLRRVADAVWTRAAQRRASVLGVGSARARADGACKQTACPPPTRSNNQIPPCSQAHSAWRSTFFLETSIVRGGGGEGGRAP